eukprot:TRINITY_DN12595_c0_g1_i1.p1 TRINITY_DN12595_c0_g1~~TRINITY_DN12595_c0_g1_i1.p1  ORF type:complete len:762 (+),score=173.48 TRINITY_DN12595_c0_g1_i1:164-2449(+)
MLRSLVGSEMCIRDRKAACELSGDQGGLETVLEVADENPIAEPLVPEPRPAAEDVSAFFIVFYHTELDKVDRFFVSQLSEFGLHIQAISEDALALSTSPLKPKHSPDPESQRGAYLPPEPGQPPSGPSTGGSSAGKRSFTSDFRASRRGSLDERQNRHKFKTSSSSMTSLSAISSDDDAEIFGIDESLGPVTRETIRQDLIEVYRELSLLKNFGVLNYTGFTKILKKFVKHRKKIFSKPELEQVHAKHKELQGELQAKEFAMHQGSLDSMIKQVEERFADMFTSGDMVEARGELLVKQRKSIDWSLFVMGVRIGLTVVLGFWLLWDSVVDPRIVLNKCHLSSEDRSLVDAAAFPVYRLCGCVNLVVWCWGLSLYVWNRNRINALYLFELAPNTTANFAEVFDLASHLSFGYFAIFLVYNKVRIGEFPEGIPKDVYPVLLLAYFGIVLYRTIRPQPCFCSNLLKVVRAPWVPVSFFQSFIADWMTSLVKPFQDLLHTAMFIGTGRAFGHCNPEYWKHCHGDRGSQDLQSGLRLLAVLLPIISGLPLLIRMFQCLRKYNDTKARMPNLANAFKYAFATVVVFFGTFSPDLYDMDDATATHYVFIVVVAVSTFYTYSWDVLQDWSLGDGKHGCLRETLMFKYRAFYYIAIFLDVFLRFLWVITLVPHNSKAPFGTDFVATISPFLGYAEILRRTMWGFIRVENEHLSNFSGYRKVKFVPLPFDEETRLEDDATKRKRSCVGLVEIVLFVLAVTAFGVIAYVTKS